MAAGVQHNAHVLAARYAARAQRVEQATADALSVWAQKVARTARDKAPKFRSELTNSIHVEDVSQGVKKVVAGSAHAWNVEHGVKAGGKGLPRYFDPESADMVAWLERNPSKAAGPARPLRKARRGSRAFQKAELSLRDRYEGMALHIRRFGVQAQPFMGPTAREMAGPVAQGLRDAVVAALTDGAFGARQ